jgi:hypothetical protein
MRPNLASLVFLSSLSARAAACVCSREYVNGSRGWIGRRLPSPVDCGAAIAAADPATSWDDPGSPPLAPSSCEPPGDCCAPPLAPSSCEPPGCVPTPSWVHVGGAPPSCDPVSSSCDCKTCKKSKSKANSSIRTRTIRPGPLGLR